jgi:hypothetical protein
MAMIERGFPSDETRVVKDGEGGNHLEMLLVAFCLAVSLTVSLPAFRARLFIA